MSDPQIAVLLLTECERHLQVLRRDPFDVATLGRTLHAVKGTAGVAGEHALAEAFSRLERRRDEAGVRDRAILLLSQAIENLRAGKQALPDSWPVPPPDLSPWQPQGDLAGLYQAQMRDRVESLDRAIAAGRNVSSSIEEALRVIHGMKGAAGSVGDEPLAWFCHGLETRIRLAASQDGDAAAMLDELTGWRSIVSRMIEDPVHALDVLRGRGSQPLAATGSGPARQSDDASWLHVPSASLDRVLDRLRLVAAVGREAAHHAEVARTTARSLRSARMKLMEARRLAGPPRPWGVPAAALVQIQQVEAQLAQAASTMERAASASIDHTRTVQRGTAASRVELESLRNTTMAAVFDKVRASVEASAGRSGSSVQVEQRGGSTPLGTRLADALVDPLLQLARNAVAHGIEPPEIRIAAGKPPHGKVILSAEARGAHLVVAVEDDGAGVNVEALRTTALRDGLITTETARDADDEAIVHLVFLPGLTTRRSADLLAGRGVGLDLALHAVRRLGGTIRMYNRPGAGLRAVVEVPLVERDHVRVLWVSTGAHHLALPARQVLRIRRADDLAVIPPSLASRLDARTTNADAGLVLDLATGAGQAAPLCCSVHSVDSIDEAPVRPVPSLVATAGPYVGVVLAPDGTPALLVDAVKLAEQQQRRSAAEPALPSGPS